MERVLEPELMEDEEQVIAYATADFEKPHSAFIHRLQTMVNDPTYSGEVLDLGCGSGDISYRFALAFPNCNIDAIDGSKPMIDYGLNSTSGELQSRISFIHGMLPDTKLPKPSYDMIICNSLLHHLPNPQVLWRVVRQYSKSGTQIAIMDLLRPCSTEIAKMMVDRYTSDEPEILKRDFYYSLLAAFTFEEINIQLSEAGLPLTVEQISDRHVFISGILG
jgi:ubiquinone/menaquinone biosynthesis C-methylase UbiE